jgi:hypothetical protein
MEGTTMTAIQTIGYDRQKKKYAGTRGRLDDDLPVKLRRDGRRLWQGPDS